MLKLKRGVCMIGCSVAGCLHHQSHTKMSNELLSALLTGRTQRLSGLISDIEGTCDIGSLHPRSRSRGIRHRMASSRPR